MLRVLDIQCSVLFICSCKNRFLAFIAFLYADLPILLRPSTAVMATKSRHVSEVMATVQISVVAEEKKRS